ncbi:MAG: MEDS domain-containing protein [Candidatus Limnocylindrales bacterium]
MRRLVQAAIEPALERGDCEHTAILLQSAEELPAVLASFYRLGRARNGWLVHGSLPGQGATDRQLITDAGIDVVGLEAAGRMAIIELDLSVSPEEWVKPWSELLQDKLSAGFDAMWFTRFPIGPTTTDVAGVLPFEAVWMTCFRGRRVVTLCPYIVGDMDEAYRSVHRGEVSSVHDQVVLAA